MMDKEELNHNIKKDPRFHIMLGVLILFFGLGIFAFWAFTAPLTQGVVAPGTVTYINKRTSVQHLHGGEVAEIFVKEGSRVSKGDLMLRLDDSVSKARVASARSEYMTAMAVESRLIAEHFGYSDIDYPKELIDESSDPEIKRVMRTQTELFKKRIKSIENQKQILRSQKSGIVEYIDRMKELTDSRARQISLVENEISSVSEIAKEGYYPRNKIIELQRTLSGLQATRSQELANIEQRRQSLVEIDFKIIQIENDFSKSVEAELTDWHKNVLSFREQYYANRVSNVSMNIKAPTDGTVLGLTVHHKGGVIGAGNKIMDIAPLHSDLIVEIQVAPQDIDSIGVGLKAEVRFSTLDLQKTPSLFGDVEQLSPDVFSDPSGRLPPYYLGQVKIPKSEIDKLGGQKVQAGMPVEVIVKTGERTLMQYLIKPFLNRFALSFKEE